jgi:hypothetical protein
VESKKITLDTLNGGAPIELFQEAWKKLVENVADENTKPNAVRSITLKVSVKPSEDRGRAETMVEVKENLAPMKPHSAAIVFSFDGSKVEAFAISNPKQPELSGIGAVNADPEVFEKAANGERI